MPGEAGAANKDLDRGRPGALRAGDIAPPVSGRPGPARTWTAAGSRSRGRVGTLEWIPSLGTPVADARELVQALDDATSVAAIGADLSPLVGGQGAPPCAGTGVEGQTLDHVIAGVREIGGELASADAE